MSVAEKVLEELRRREDLREAFAEELLPILVKNRKLRILITTSLLREIATKDDLKDLENRLRKDIDGLRKDIDNTRKGLRDEINNIKGMVLDLSQRVSRLERMMSLFIKLFIAFNVPILIGIIGILLKMIFTTP